MSDGAFSIDAKLLEERESWRRSGRRVVFSNGCFDLLHSGHLALLESARSLGDMLIVAINSDASVGKLKGPGRPLVPERERAELLLALEPVDRVVIFAEDTPREAVAALVPDVLVKGADWGADAIVGTEIVLAAGGRVVRVDTVPGRSSSAILERIRRS